MTTYARRLHYKFSDDEPIGLMETPARVSSTMAIDLAAVIGIVVVVFVLAWVLAQIPGAA